MIELKFTINRETMKEGASFNFEKRHFKWYILSFIIGVVAICYGIHKISVSSKPVFLPCLIIACGVTLF